VIAANRDELYARPARPPERLGGGLAGGVDALSGGTWLAVDRRGRFAAVTNQRAVAPAPSGVRSRGLAVRELAAAADPDAYVAAIDPTQYASMNLVWGDPRGVSIAYSRHEGTLEIERLSSGIHVLCNDRLGSPDSPRGERLAAAIASAPRHWSALGPALERALADHTRAATPPSLTATCIHSPTYGTRSSTIFAARPDQALAYLHADGPPCTAPFLDRAELL